MLEQHNEIWKDIDGYVGIYQVSNFGRVKSLDREICNGTYIRKIKGKILKGTIDKDGYLIVGFLHNKKYKVHRLVATAFVDNPNMYLQVNHIDGNKKNNNFWNLEWCDNAHNQRHAYDIGLKKTRAFAKVDIENNKVLKIYFSLSEVISENNGYDPSSIIKVCRNKRAEHYGYKWIYANDNLKVGDVID